MWSRWTKAIRDWAYQGRPAEGSAPRIGLALGGGFSRALAHVGVLQVFEENHIPIHCIAGISSGAIIASTYASGTPLEEIISVGVCTTFNSYARWTLSRLGLATSERMDPWLRKALRRTCFEEMQTPLAVVATDLLTGAPVTFKDRGDMIAPVRATCAYPGLFLPVEIGGRWLVDGGISVSAPVDAVREMGATHVIAVYLHTVNISGIRPSNLLQVVGQCFSILQDRMMTDWREAAQLVIEPNVAEFAWNDFDRAKDLVRAGRDAALDALPIIQKWFQQGTVSQAAPAAASPLVPLISAASPRIRHP
ncbi:MAG TPA: patatin-like phospholipase family protein [Bryobacterales bacterium]|nr:patatin-like phospholipase family protein [Bryobacterales bacterium]